MTRISMLVMESGNVFICKILNKMKLNSNKETEDFIGAFFPYLVLIFLLIWMKIFSMVSRSIAHHAWSCPL